VLDRACFSHRFFCSILDDLAKSCDRKGYVLFIWTTFYWLLAPSVCEVICLKFVCDLLCFVFMSAYCMFDLSVYYLYLQYFDTVGWVF